MFGMFMFYAIALTVFLWWLFITTLFVMGGGLDTRTALQAFLADTGSILDGAIVALAYFSNVQNRFSQKNFRATIVIRACNTTARLCYSGFH